MLECCSFARGLKHAKLLVTAASPALDITACESPAIGYADSTENILLHSAKPNSQLWGCLFMIKAIFTDAGLQSNCIFIAILEPFGSGFQTACQ